MKYILPFLFVLLSTGISAQNSSFGLGMGVLNLENSSGLHFSANVRSQFTNTLGWQTEVGYLSMDDEFNFLIRGSKAMSLKTAVTTKFFEREGFSVETIIGGGMFKDNINIFGLLSGELFISARLGKNLVAGIPVSYNFVTWSRISYYTTGISLRFHM